MHINNSLHIPSSSSIKVPTVGAQAFLMDHTQGERAITPHADPVRIVGGFRYFLLNNYRPRTNNRDYYYHKTVKSELKLRTKTKNRIQYIIL
jgi:hypothetical protein